MSLFNPRPRGSHEQWTIDQFSALCINNSLLKIIGKQQSIDVVQGKTITCHYCYFTVLLPFQFHTSFDWTLLLFVKTILFTYLVSDPKFGYRAKPKKNFFLCVIFKYNLDKNINKYLPTSSAKLQVIFVLENIFM